MTKIDLTARKPIWKAISEFYLDTELQEMDFKHIASIIIESPYTLEEIKLIDEKEVFPVLKNNLLSVAGVWTGFEEDWLYETIQNRLNKPANFFNKINSALNHQLYKQANSISYWERLEKAYFDCLP